MTVNADVVDVCTRYKFEKAPKNAKKHILLKTKRVLNIKMSAEAGPFLHLACQGCRSSLASRQLRHC